MQEYQVTVYHNKTEWRQNGVPHRIGGPAVEYANGVQLWYKHGGLHREDGPAFVRDDGSMAWYKNGKRHREDGPAIEDKNGETQWWIDGVQYTEAEFLAKTQPTKELTIADIEKLLGYRVKVVK